MWKRWGLPRFTRVPLPEGLGCASPPAAPHLRAVYRRHPYLAACLLAQASQPLWLVVSYDGSTAVRRVRGGPRDPPLPSEPSERLSPHSAQALIRHREAPGDQAISAAFTIRVCTRLTNVRRAFNDTFRRHRLSNHDGLAFPPLSRDTRPAGSQPPCRAGQMQNPYPNHYSPAFAFSGIPYPLVHRFTLAGDLPLPVETMGLTTFRTSTIPGGIRPRLSAGGTTSARGVRVSPLPRHLPFGSSLSASLACCP